jgi:hypothetical protein
LVFNQPQDESISLGVFAGHLNKKTIAFHMI